MAVWNLQGGELFFYRSNASCQSLYEAETPYVQIGWGNLAANEGGLHVPYYECPPIGATLCVQRSAIWLNDSDFLYAFVASDIEGRLHAQSIFTHEFGHAVGMAHTNHEGDVMDQDYAIGEFRTALSQHDRNGYIFRYGNTH